VPGRETAPGFFVSAAYPQSGLSGFAKTVEFSSPIESQPVGYGAIAREDGRKRPDGGA
jgi:hypothetical protein